MWLGFRIGVLAETGTHATYHHPEYDFLFSPWSLVFSFLPVFSLFRFSSPPSLGRYFHLPILRVTSSMQQISVLLRVRMPSFY